MPIVASRGSEIRRLLAQLADPKRRAGAVLRLRSLGARVVPHVEGELGQLDAETRSGLLEALREVQTADGTALKKRLMRADVVPRGPGSGMTADEAARRIKSPNAGAEAVALEELRALPPPRSNERASVSRARAEAHLALARIGSRLARRDLLLSLDILDAGRARLYCEAAGLIGDLEFLAPLARIAGIRPEASAALAQIASRESITTRSKALRNLEKSPRPIVAKALAAG